MTALLRKLAARLRRDSGAGPPLPDKVLDQVSAVLGGFEAAAGKELQAGLRAVRADLVGFHGVPVAEAAGKLKGR